MKQRYNAIVGFTAALIFSLLYVAGMFGSLEDRLYDFFLRFRADRQRMENIVFLDVDDHAIAHNGVFPWPRSIPAEGLLRLKEYGALAVIFDIEYIDQGPQGVDSLYLNQGLGHDFNRSFSDINSAAQDIFSALKSGRVGRADIDNFSGSFSALINSEHKNLFSRAQGIARDNDRFLAQALALNGRGWFTLNLRDFPLGGEQAKRRPVAEKLFSYPVIASDDAHRGAGFIDILSSLPVFADAAAGAGFTNVEIDNDGVRRRVYLAQNIFDHWYLQLSFAPLINYLGSPEIALEKNRLTIRQAQFPGGRKKDIVIPLDQKGCMMLDWPKENYTDSYSHISFAQFSQLDDIDIEQEYYIRALSSADLLFFTQFDSSLNRTFVILGSLEDSFEAANTAKNLALENTSGIYFDDYTRYRSRSLALLDELISLKIDIKVMELSSMLSEEYPENAEMIEDEAGNILQLISNIKKNHERRNELNSNNDKMMRNKFVIIGRADTGTTDYGANPFHGKYIDAGAHAVVLDTILSGSFIKPLGIWWRIAFLLIIIPVFFIYSSRFSPVIRTLTGFVLTFIFFFGAILLFRLTGVYWGPLGVIFAMIAAIITREVIAYVGSEKEKQFIRTAFSACVSHDVVKEIIADPSRLQLGGTKRCMTAIFTGVKSFTAISEKLDPEELVSLLNHYLSAMSGIILNEKGTIDKYEGDAIIAFFGAPLDLPDHPLRACMAAINMRKAEIELNKIILEQKLSPIPLVTRIGINTGFMVAGNMGTADKMNYTIMGNAANLAARLEGVNKQYGTSILTTEETIRGTGDLLLTRKLDRIRVAGINEPVRLLELQETAAGAAEQQRKLVPVFHEALELFEKRRWKQAADGFKAVLAVNNDDYPSKMYLERSSKFISKPPEDKWDGVYNMTAK